MKKLSMLLLILCTLVLLGQDNRPQPTEAEIQRMRNAAPALAVKPLRPRNVLVFVETKGFYHTSIPFATKSLEVIGEKTGAFKVTLCNGDPNIFEPESLKRYDVIFLNNNTSRLPLGGVDYAKMPAGKERDEAEAREMRLRKSFLDFVREDGKGIVGIHAATDAFYTWPEYGEMMGGFFDAHPWSEKVGVELVDPGHPLMKGWRGCPFDINEEIYQQRNPYSRDKQRVLMRLDVKRTNMNKGNQIHRKDGDFALAWLKSYGKGRVVYIGFGHRHETFWNSGMMQMMLDAIQYCAGDLKLDKVYELPSNQVDEAYLKESARLGFERGLDDICAELSQYKHSIEDTAARQIERLVNEAENPAQRQHKAALAAHLAALLKRNNSVDCRNFALRQLSRIASGEEVAAIAPWIGVEETSVMALYALQRITGKEADDALIAALASVPAQRSAVAAILGMRKTAAAVAPLSKYLSDAACGPTVALGIGAIGTVESAKVLSAALPTAKGELRRCVMVGLTNTIGALSAQNGLVASQALLSAADCPANFKAAAQAQVFVAAGDNVDTAQVLAVLKNGDVHAKAAVAKALPQMKNAFAAVIKEIAALPVDSVGLVLNTVAASKAVEYEANVIKLLDNKDDKIAMAAAGTLELIGGAASVLPLANMAGTGDVQRQNQAKRALYRMVGEPVDVKIRQEVSNMDNGVAFRAALISALGVRQDRGAVAVLEANALSSDKDIRREAIAALALVASEKDLPSVVELLTKTNGTADRNRLMNIVINVGKRAEDQAAASGAILKALNGEVPVPVRVALLESLGKLAHESALPTLTAAAADDNPAVKRIAILALGEWPNDAPMATLRGISRDANASQAHKVLALRGYARLLALPSSRPVKQTLDMYKEALALAGTSQEKGSLINGLGYLLHPDALKLAMEYLEVPEVANEAVLSATRIMNGLNGAVMSFKSSHGGSHRNAIDRNTKTRWTSGKTQAGDEWFQIDMGFETTISEIKLFAGDEGNDFPVGYKVFVSLDGENWGDKPVAEGAGKDKNTVIAVPDVYGRYIKIFQTGRGNMYWSINELSINGMPEDYGKPLDNKLLKLSASKGGNGLQNAVDGNASTRWTSGGPQQVGDWFMIELPREMNVRKIALDSKNSAKDYPHGYRVDVSKDGKSWFGPVGMGNGEGGISNLMLLKNQAKFVKITLTESDTTFYWSIHGLSVFVD